MVLPDPGWQPRPAFRAEQDSDRFSTPHTPAPHWTETGPGGLYHLAPGRSFGEAISVCFSNYATFSGRASRSEYWFFYLFTFLVGIVGGIFESGGAAAVSAIIQLGILVPTLAVTVRRLHDTNRSGWWLGGPALGLVGFVILAMIVSGGSRSMEPLAGGLLAIGGLGLVVWSIALTVVLCFKGDPGRNQFG